MLRRSAPYACALINAAAAAALLVALRGGSEVEPDMARRAAYITEHPWLWRGGWCVWIAAASSLLAFYAWWGARLPSSRLALAAFAVAVSGICCDVTAESLYIGWLPRDLATIGPLATLLTGGAANGLYTVAGVLLTLGTPTLRGLLRAWTWAVWASGAALTASALAGSVAGMVVSTGIMMPLFCTWVVVLGRHLRQQATAVQSAG